MIERSLWKISDVAEYLGLPLSSVYKMTATKSMLRIPHVRIAGRVRFRKSDIDEWLQLLTISNNAMLTKINSKISQKVSQNGIYS